MNVENHNIEPVTDLGLALGYSSQCTQRKSNNDSGAGAGAGANAGSRIDMKFVASDPLSELVWSPQNGLSLKCADCSFVDKKPSLLRNAGPSNTVLSPSQNITAGRSRTDKPVNKENFQISQVAFHIKSEMAGRDTQARTAASNVASLRVHRSSQEDRRDEIRLHLVQNEKSSEDPMGGGRDFGSGNKTSRMETALDSEVHPTKDCQANDTLVQTLTSPGRGNEVSDLFLEKKRKNDITMTIGVNPMEKMESTSENDVQSLISKNFCDEFNKIGALDSTHETKNSLELNEATRTKDKNVTGEHSPTNSRILSCQRKGKEKALSDGDVNERMSKEDDDSHESVESCNSTGLFPTGKRRCSFEQQLIVGSKRVKKQIQESPVSASCVKQDSSFMNWISNMMKGFSKPNQDEAPSLALTLANPYHGHENPDRKLITCNKSQDPECTNTGFQSIFRSLYCPKAKVEETLDDDCQTELVLSNRLCHISTATPLSCHADNDNFCEQFLISNEKFNESTSGNGADPATQPKISFANFASSQDNSKVNSENKNSCNLTAGEVKGGTDSNSSIGKHKASSTEKINNEPPSEVKTTNNFDHGGDPLRSLWITRFTPKTSFPLLNLQNSSGALECSTNCHVGYFNDLKIMDAGPCPSEDLPTAVAKELQNCAAITEASTGFNRMKGHNDQKSICKLNSIFPSPRFKYSEAMASDLARKLDAFKNIAPSYVTDNAACAAITCFFCGKKGHYLQDCSEVTDGELEYLKRNFNSYNGAEELPCLCIRCFQLNHWAIACPYASSRVQNQLDCGASLCDDFSPIEMDFSPIEMQLNKRNEESTKLSDGNKSPFQASVSHTVCHQIDPQIEKDHNYNCKTHKLIHETNLVKDYIPSSSRENKLKENQIIPFCNFVDKQVLEGPREIFDAVKKLRLSRIDILKWMNSHMSLTYLNGFFLRVRLGKWEEGLGGTGYFVACITGTQREMSAQNSKKPISVNVGGVNCLVESQYVSNHDFIEDELMAWWSVTTKNGSKIPTEEDLRLKLEERKMLGL